MVRETRHLWVGNLPDNIREDRIREHFKRYGRVQSVKLLPRGTKEETSEGAMACTVAFMDIKSASKAHNAEHKIDERTLTTEYYEPAAIPSAASPQNTPSSYSTSPGSTRFPNGHGTSDEHGNFSERFYDRTNNRVSDSEYIRRPGYHDNNRGRNRDRGYRNGPYNNILDRSHRLNSSWSYDASRYNNQNSDTGYSTAPSENNERRTEQSTKKKTKSRSGSRSPSPSGSTSSRSPSRSRSRSSSSSSSSSTSRATSSTGSPKSRRITTNAQYQPVVHSEDRRPLAICVRNLPCRSSDTSLKDGLFHEYKKHGKVTWVKVVGQSSERHAIVCFKKPEDVEKALEVSYDKLFFGSKIEVAPYQGYDVEDNDLRPYEAEIDEFHPKATRTLFIGNLEKDVTASDLRKHFDQFGEIIEIDIKKQGAVSSYAFCQYSDIVSVVKAIRTMDGEHLGTNRIKLGFGKSMPTGCVWVDGVVETISEKYLINQFEIFGSITQVNIDREKGQALIFYEQVLNAQAAVNKMRGVSLKGRKIQVDFASRECQEAFYEHLEKQGHITDRTAFEERRDSTTTTTTATRNFDTVTATSRFSRYDTPTRPRTSSYSSRSSAAASQCNTTAVPSPGTPGSVTPRGTGSRSRLTRYDYYDQNAEYTDRHFRSYDEYSQGSAASHEEVYEHEYYHESPSNVETVERVPATDHPAPFPLPDIKNLQKERVHLLEQLEECPSSGDELTSPKKKLKLEHLDGGIISDVIIETNRDHRKVTEVRRLSDVCVKHHSRRPSVDGKHSRDVGHDRSTYLPHAVCKRRKTAGSDSGSRVHHYDQSGSESVGGSRPGTPLCDERPEHFPTEPRRTPRDREGPLTLPLPRFAAQVLHKGSISVAGIKGQKDNVLSSPPPAVTSPRISNPKPPSPVHVPPPASPPPRPPSLSSNSSDSDVAPPSPSLDERIRSLDEKYEKWSGSRALSAAGGDALAKLDANREKFKFRHKLLDLDLKEVQPSEIVKSVMAKRSVFDEDTKRLENVGEKYEPKEFNLFPKTSTTVQTTVPVTPLSAPPVLKVSTTQLPKTPTMLSPRSAGAAIIPAKGLQYPFPSHPPLQQPVTTTTSATTTPLTASVTSSTTSSTTTATTTASTTRTSHGDNRLKPCASATSDNRTSSKVNVNRSVTSVAVSKTSDTKTNIPTANSDSSASASLNPTESTTKTGKSSREPKSSEKVSGRRDSSGSSDSKSRRNSDTGARKPDDSEKLSDNCDSSEQKEKDRLEKARIEHERQEHERQEKERSEKERLERERIDREREEKEKLEKQRLEKERLERERLERERLEKERQERERLEKERLEHERIERERLENERLEKERAKREREQREREERERKEREERERKEREREERERREKEREERERKEKEREDRERKEREEREREEQLERERLERDRRERKEREEKERKEKEEFERREKEEHERAEKERLEKEKERRREKEEERKHKEDNHEKRKDGQHRYRENHGKESVLENKIDRHDNKSTKDNNHDLSKKEHDSRNHDSRESKNRHHSDRDSERRKESIKENRENNAYEKLKNIVNEIKESKDRPMLETRHLSIDLEKNRQIDSLSRMDPNRRKERNNSLPANVGNKRRISSHDNPEGLDEAKKIKLSQEHKKLAERRDSKDGSREEKSKNKHKAISSSKVHDEKPRTDKYNNTRENSEEKRKDKEERHKSRLQKLEKQKLKSKNRDSRESPSTPGKDLTIDKEFLSRLEFAEMEKQKQRKEAKEKRKAETENDDRKSDDSKRSDEHRRKERKSREEGGKNSEDRRKKDRIRKMTQSSENSDSDEPKKHSIFDIVDDEPAYISMYDKVKARSCKNMQKQEEEKRQEKIKAKFSQLKQSRAKREEKKRSTSWDEDSDSDRNEPKDGKARRANKMLIASSDEEEGSHKKREVSSDSESRLPKSEQADSSDEDRIKSASFQRKGSKSRITSDTSDEEFKKVSKIKSEIFSDNDDNQPPPFDYDEALCQILKEECDYNKKQRKNAKHQELMVDLNTQIFGEASSAEELEKKDKSESRKKHKKKQKRQKSSVSSEESVKLEVVLDALQIENYEKMKSSEKKKQHSKKDKKRDKSKDEEKVREKSKKSKKNKQRDGKMENIFGSLSDDSEHGTKEQGNPDHKRNSFLEHIVDENHHQAYASDSDSVSQTYKNDEKEREHRKRKEKKRREKEKRQREEINENSMDFVDLGKQLEDNIKDDSNECLDDIVEVKLEPVDVNSHETKKDERKELKEKKKKRKKSKEEKQRHHHHHHHHDKSKIKSELSTSSVNSEVEIKTEPNASLPNIADLDRESPVNATKEKKRDKFIPGFGSEIDEQIHESAVKSISEFEPKTEPKEPEDEVSKEEKTEVPEEKPRVVISQEETEDAVAALLGESFGSGQFDDCYGEQQISPLNNEQVVNISDENVQDDEEMRQAVQSLNSSELELMKPDTPLSEHELQIDTDTEEAEEITLRYDPPPKTPDNEELARPPKTPDVPNYYRNDEQKTVKTATSIGSPPSLTPIKQSPHVIIDNSKSRSKSRCSTNSLPLLPEQKTVISQSWSVNDKKPSDEAKPEPVQKVEEKLPPLTIQATQSIPTKTIAFPCYKSMPVLKITDSTANQNVVDLQAAKHNVPAHIPYPVPLQKPSEPSSKVSTMNRLPITSVMVSKPLQSTTLVLPQGQSLEPPKLVPTQERSRLIYHNATQFTGPPIIQQSNLTLQRTLPTQGLVMPSKVPPATYASLCLTLKGSPVIEKHHELPKLVPTSPSQFPDVVVSQPVQIQSSSIIIANHSIHKSVATTSSVTSLSTTVVPKVKSFNPVIQATPKLVSINSGNTITDILSSVPTIIQQAPPRIQTPPISAKEPENVDFLQVPRISAASPVIVTVAKDQKPAEIPSPPPETIQVKEVTPAAPLAIEKVTEELNLSLEKDDHEDGKQLEAKENTEVEIPIVKPEPESVSVIKEIEKFDEEKAETESVVSDMSKERLSAELSSKDDPLDSKEDSDYWSAKEVNIDSVIKKVDALCSADELSDRSSEIGKDDWYEEHKIETTPGNKEEKQEFIPQPVSEEKIENNDEKESSVPRGGRRGGRPRGNRKTRGGVDRVGVQTRRGKVGAKETTTTPSKRGGRAGRPKSERKITKSDCETSADIYEFRDDSDDANKDRPRLILTIKPVVTNAANGSTQQTAVVKEVMKISAPSPQKVVEAKEEFASPVTNTRKSRRLQEKDISKNTVDDTIEDVVKNTAVMVTRSAAAQGLGPRRSARQTAAAKTLPDTPRKSPRASKKKDRRASETTDDSSEEKTAAKIDTVPKIDVPEVPKPEEKTIKEKPHEGLKAAVLRRVKGEMNQEPMTLIDPVTGLLTPMRECEEGKYIPVSGASGPNQIVQGASRPNQIVQKVADESKITTPLPQTAVVIKQHKPQSLKAHVLSSQAAKAVVSQIQAVQKPITSPVQPMYAVKPSIPVSQSLNVNVSLPSYATPHLSPRTTVASKPVHNMKVVQSPLSPNQMVVLSHQPKQVLQADQNIVPKTQVVSPIQRGLLPHPKQSPVVKQPVGKQASVGVKQATLLLNTAIMGKHGLHQQQLIPGGVPSPAAANNINRLSSKVTALIKPIMDPPKVEVSMAGCAMVPRSNVSPQSQPRHVLQAGMPVPAYEASLGEPMGAHFPPGPLRPPHDLPPSHYMHPSHVIYQQYLRPYHLPRSPIVSGAIEKPGDGQEGEEAPVTSPPLELRRPGSVGLAITGRANAVPHSLQSPHDRATDSPQVGQVYNMHSARMQHYHPGQYFEEPPPAHRPVTSHGSLAALGNKRSLTHIGPLGTPDRPLSAHSAVGHMGNLGTPDRPLSTLPDSGRPLSSHGLALTAGLGAAGNLLGAVARHIGVDTPTGQRGLQIATPPYASQVPPQAESLLILLKQYPCMWQGLLALKNDQAAVQMYFVSGNDSVAKFSLPKNTDGSTPPLRIFQRMRLEPPQLEGVARKMQMENEHCMLLALPCGRDHMDVLKQSTNLNTGFITYLQQKQAAGIINVAAPGTVHPPAYVIHIFPSCDFVNENLRRIAPSLLERVADIAHLLIVITTV